MTKTILLATVVAVTILGLSTASVVFNNTVTADHGEPLPAESRECLGGGLAGPGATLGGIIVWDPVSERCIPSEECPNGFSLGDLDRVAHCNLIPDEPPTDICETCEIRAERAFDSCVRKGGADAECRDGADIVFSGCVGDVMCTPAEERTPVRDNVDIENIKLKNGQFRVIVDNAGIGATSDVEITWNFKEKNCVVIAAGDVGGFATVALVDDGAFSDPPPIGAGVPVGHNDVKFAEAILLGVNGDAEKCEIKSKKGEYVSVSTIGMGGPGSLDTSNPTGP